MRKIVCIFLLICTLFVSAQNNTPIGTWRMHLPYKSVEQMIEYPNHMIVRTEAGIYDFDLLKGHLEYYTKVTGFSENETVEMAYSQDLNALVIGYANTNVDLLKGDRIINLPGILRSSIIGAKKINDIKIYGNLAYVSCSFGMVVIDIEKEEIKDDFQKLGPNGTNISVTGSAVYRDSLFLATPSGILAAPANDPQVNLKNFESWNEVGNFDSVYSIIDFNNSLIFVEDSVMYQYDGTYSMPQSGAKFDYKNMQESYGELIITRDEGVIGWEKDGSFNNYGILYKSCALKDHQDAMWYGGFYSGLFRKAADGQELYVYPPGPFGLTSYEMRGFNNQMWVSSGGVDARYGPTFNDLGYYMYEDGDWINSPKDIAAIDTMYDFTAIEIDKETGDQWFATFGRGLVHLKNGQFIESFHAGNSLIDIAPGNQQTVLGLALDSKKNLWMSNYETTHSLVVRRSDGSWEDFLLPTRRTGEMIVDEFDQLWITIPRTSGTGIIVFKEEDGVAHTQPLTTGTNGGLPNNNVTALQMDKDGEIWVGTEAGMAVFYNPSLVFEGGVNANAQQIIIDDGNDIGYLLGTEVINDIKIDGGNRKWVATNNGAWLIAEDGSGVITHFTIANSPLPCNEVKCIDVVPNTGEVFFGTNCGIASFRGNATEAGNTHSNPLVYPNPVHTDYEGPITITGLPEDATVKIADVAGRVVYELIATGGTAVWDGYRFDGERPATGVYLIFTSNKDDEDTLVSKLLFVR